MLWLPLKQLIRYLVSSRGTSSTFVIHLVIGEPRRLSTAVASSAPLTVPAGQRLTLLSLATALSRNPVQKPAG